MTYSLVHGVSLKPSYPLTHYTPENIAFMSLSSVELWQKISSAGLAAPMICRSWAAEALQDLPPSDAANATKILEQLVRLGRLTNYQAELIAGRRQGEFKRGVWTLLRPVEVPLWEGWFEATKAPNEPSTWLRWLSSEALAELKNAAPSLPRGLRLAQLKGPNLQGVLVPELIDKHLQLQVQPLQGVPLAIAFPQEASLGRKATDIIRQVAEALLPLHKAEMAHGRVLPDRVYWHAQRGVTLARDPLCCQTASLDPKAIGVIQDGLNGLSPAQFMAPEFLAPGQVPTPSSDIYSLGCLWWWLVTGKPLVVGSTLDKQLARQAEASIALPKDCDLPPPFVRCLQHCLAKNLPARFASAEQLCQALDAASVAVATGPVARQRVEKQTTFFPSKPVATPAEQLAPPAKQPLQSAAPKSAANKSIARVAEQLAVLQPTVLQPAKRAVAEAPKSVQAAATVKVPGTAQSKNQPITPQPISNSQPTPPVERSVSDKVSNRDTHNENSDPRNVERLSARPPIVIAPEQMEKIPASQPVATDIRKQDAPELLVPKLPSKPTINQATNQPRVRKKAKRKPGNKWALPLIGGLGAVCALLGILIASGVLKPRAGKVSPKPVASDTANEAVDLTDSKGTKADAIPSDPRLDVYRIVPTGKDLLWAPPAAPKPIALDLLPPGGQIFVTLRPKQLMASATGKLLMAGFNDELAPYLGQISQRAGVPLDSIDRVTVACYAENEVLMTCMRVQLAKPLPLSALKTGWGLVANEQAATVTLLSKVAGDSYFVAQQPLLDAQSVSEFSFGPTALMKESAELQGAAGPLVSQMGKLWQDSDADADLSLLLTSSFLFSEGKSILASMPKRLASRMRELLEIDSRAALLQTRLEPAWYVEAQLIGLSEREAPRLSELLRQRISGASTAVEDWFVSEQPHPYWRALAIRYPQMLRAFAEQSRFGTEGGVAVANTYLPPEAAVNILLSSWIASQESATLVSDAPTEAVVMTPTAKPLSLEEYLSRKIRLSFDQEPIETALRLVGEEANANLPADTPSLRFALDGGAFERAGITRNQQLKDFKHIDLPLRDALTAIAKRGNPVTTVKDTRDKDQRLIWVVRDDPEQVGKQMVSLTTRAEAEARNIPLPIEFAPAQ